MLTIRDIQGDALLSPYANQHVTTRGIVTGVVRRGFFIQTPGKTWDTLGSDAVFVYGLNQSAMVGSEVQVSGECLNYLRDDGAKPVTQIHLAELIVINASAQAQGLSVSAIELTASHLSQSNAELARFLNSLEGMLVTIPKGATFISPSNSFGDYVLALEDQYNEEGVIASPEKGVIVESVNPLRWFAGFRVTRYQYAQRLNVGATLLSNITGPLNYRVGSYQVSVSDEFKVDPKYIELCKSSLCPSEKSLTVMTLNCFNLDGHVESADNVVNSRKDIDDDWGEGRFHTLAQAVVLQANLPDIVAVQEIQDNDGAELTDVTDASETYALLIKAIEQLSGLVYEWVDIEPELGADGGQPGGNIRNGYLYNPLRVSVEKDSLKTLGSKHACYEGSRKPLLCYFREKTSNKILAIINVHLASKRHQKSIFAPTQAGVDAKLQVRTEQARLIKEHTNVLEKSGIDFYVTGDFNDGEYSEPLNTLVGNNAANLVFSLDENRRYDYNHRGKLQVLMHGIVSKKMHDQGRADYEIIHGNELIGVQPGSQTDKPSDHAYVIAKLHLC